MGTYFNKNTTKYNEINEMMSKFYFKSIDTSQIFYKIEFYINNKNLSFYELWKLIKLLGVHEDAEFQHEYWMTSYEDTNGNSFSILFLLLILSCKDKDNQKINYIKDYLKLICLDIYDNNPLIIKYSFMYNILYGYLYLVILISLKVVKKITLITIKNEEYYNITILKKYLNYILDKYIINDNYINVDLFLLENLSLIKDDCLVRNSYSYFICNNVIKTYEMLKQKEDQLNIIKLSDLYDN